MNLKSEVKSLFKLRNELNLDKTRLIWRNKSAKPQKLLLMKNILLIVLLISIPILLLSQINVVREGISINNTDPGTWYGDNISRIVSTKLIYRNNAVTSINSAGYMLQAGDEVAGVTNNNLDGEVITGNKFTWNGTDITSITHGIFTGHNINALIQYNYLDKVPMSIIRKSNGMTNTSGGVAYNIVRSPNVGMVVKGMNNVNIYNNTFYNERTTAETSRGMIEIYTNTDISPNAPSTGTQIFNNIFYTKHQIININILYAADLANFKSDYNLFYCEDGTPLFRYLGTTKTFAQWQALGYDKNSVVINPNFVNTIDLVPAARLNYGSNLGFEWQTGLATSAKWVLGTSPATANQNGTWQVGARLYQSTTSVSGITVTEAAGSNKINTYKGTLQVSASVLPTDASDKSVTWSIVNGSNLATVNSSGLVTAIANGSIIVRATANDGSGIKGELAITISNQNILIQSILVTDNLPDNIISGIGIKLALQALFNPLNASNKSLNWSVENLTGQATIDANGLLTTTSQGSINVIVKANDGSMVSYRKEYVIVIPVGTENMLNLKNLNIFPNPSQDKIQIQYDKIGSDGFTLEIISEQGQILEKRRIFEPHSEWSLAQYSGNTFLIRVTDQTGSVTKKIILSPVLK